MNMCRNKEVLPECKQLNNYVGLCINRQVGYAYRASIRTRLLNHNVTVDGNLYSPI